MSLAKQSAAQRLCFDVASGATKGTNEYQQDTLLANFPMGQGHGFAILADGMGGQLYGEVASALATSEVFAHLVMHNDEIEAASPNMPLILRDAAQAANVRIARQIESKPDQKGMGTTLVAPIISGRHLSWISIGDSLLLLFRDGALRRLNKNHSLAQDIDAMVRTGALDPELGRDHPDRHVLTSAVDGGTIARIDCPSTPIMLAPEDVLIVASDGLESLPSTTIANILALSQDKPSAEIVDAFLGAIAASGLTEQDNASLIVIRVEPSAIQNHMMAAEDMPVLAMAQPSPPPAVEVTPAQPFAVERTTKTTPQETAPPEVVAKEEKKKYYYYRGQRYLRED